MNPPGSAFPVSPGSFWHRRRPTMARCFFRRAPHLPNNHQISAALQSLGIVAPKVHAECLLLGIARGAASEGALWSQTLVMGPPLPPHRNVVGACPFPDLSACRLPGRGQVAPARRRISMRKNKRSIFSPVSFAIHFSQRRLRDPAYPIS